MQVGDMVKVVGPKGSAQLGMTGRIISITTSPIETIVEVQLDGERRRNFKIEDLAKQ